MIASPTLTTYLFLDDMRFENMDFHFGHTGFFPPEGLSAALDFESSASDTSLLLAKRSSLFLILYQGLQQ